MSRFEYPQFCPVARGAEIVGERWTLLVARELLLGPHRFSDLLERLAPISSSVLSGRLASLEERGLIAQRTLAPPAASVVYELTELGQTLRPVVEALGRFGARFLFPARGPGETLNPEWTLLAPATFAKRASSPALRVALEVLWNEKHFPFLVVGGPTGTRVEEARRSAPTTATVVLPLLVPLLAGVLDLDAAERSGALRIAGERAPLRQLSECFEMDFGGHEAALADLPGLASMYRVPNPTTADGRT